MKQTNEQFEEQPEQLSRAGDLGYGRYIAYMATLLAIVLGWCFWLIGTLFNVPQLCDMGVPMMAIGGGMFLLLILIGE